MKNVYSLVLIATLFSVIINPVMAITNGLVDENNQFENTVALVNKHTGKIFCSGVFISSTLVATAGHCLMNGKKKKPLEEIGIYRGKGILGGKVLSEFGIKKIKVRNCYPRKPGCDFGYLEITRNIVSNQSTLFASEKTLKDHFNKYNPSLTYVGYGFDNKEFGLKKTAKIVINQIPEELRYLTKNYQEISECMPPNSLNTDKCFYALMFADNYHNIANIHRSEVLRSKYGVFSVFDIESNSKPVYGTNSGDSGGPVYMMKDNQQILSGIIIGGTGNKFYIQSVAIPFSKQLRWLKRHISRSKMKDILSSTL